MTATATPVEYRQCAGCGETFPIRSKYAYRAKWCSARCRKAQYDRACADCGGRVDGTTPGRVVTGCCVACANRRKGERMRRERRIRLELIAAMWNAGMKRSQIADALGLAPKTAGRLVSQARADAIEATYRRPDAIALGHEVARIRWGR